jgi:hypothetical protein
MKKFSVFLCTLAFVFGTVGYASAYGFIGGYGGYGGFCDGPDCENIESFYTEQNIDTSVYFGNSANFTFDLLGEDGIDSDDWFINAELKIWTDCGAAIGKVEYDGDSSLFLALGPFAFPDEFNVDVDLLDDFTLDVEVGAAGYLYLEKAALYGDYCSVPEPASMLLLGFGLLGLVGIGRKKIFKK